MSYAMRWFFCVFLIVCGVQPTAAREMAAVPAMWVIDGGKGTVEILGSVHLLKPGTKWYEGRVREALERADSLTLETVLDPAGMKKIQEITIAEGLYPEGQTLKAAVPAALYRHAVESAQKMGLQEAVIQRFKPWYASVVLASGMVQGMGFDPQAGVEKTLTEEAKLRGVKIAGLETPEEQIMTLASTPEAVQLAMLQDTMTQFDEVKTLLDKMTAAWTTGDLKTLEGLLLDDLKSSKELYDIVLVKRNEAWVPKIRALLDQPGRHLLVVGAAHLIGPDSVIAKLEKAGVTVRRE